MWKIRQMQKSEMNQDPFQEAFFDSEAMRSPVDALVREDLQNRLDAGIGNGPIKLRVYFPSESNHLTPEVAEKYLDGLWPHLNAGATRDLPKESDPLRFVVLEDFGTRGLVGDISQNDDDPGNARRNDFFYFFRNVGRSQKSEGDRGRWGLGKIVYPASSLVQSFIALTKRNDDGKTLVMGQCVINQHQLDGKKFYPYGYFGTFTDPEDPSFVTPIDDKDAIEAVKLNFRLSRKEEAGLSLILFHPVEELNRDNYLKSCLAHYFLPIVTGQLEIVLETDDGSIHLRKDSVGEIVGTSSLWTDHEKEMLLKLFRLAEWSSTTEDYIAMPGFNSDEAPKWNSCLIDKSELPNLRQRFDSGERLAFKIPIVVQKIGEAFSRSHFTVYVEKDEALREPAEAFIRMGLTISGERHLKESGIRGIIRIDDKPVATMVGDSENPAHTEWQFKGKKFRKKYEKGSSRLTFIKHSLREIVRQLIGHISERQDNLLEEFFYLPIEEPGSAPETKAKGKRQTTVDTPVIHGKAKGFSVNKIRGGFKIISVPNSTPKPIQIKAAYEVLKGNPFKKYDPLDFVLSRKPIVITAKGGRYDLIHENEILFTPSAERYEITVKGFDKNRDLVISAS